MRRAFAIAGLDALLSTLIYGQATTAAPAFDVASVKVSNSVDYRGSFHIDDGRISMHNYSMVGIIQYAYHINFDRIAGPTRSSPNTTISMPPSRPMLTAKRSGS